MWGLQVIFLSWQCVIQLNYIIMSSHLWSISYTYSNRYYNAFKSFFSDSGEESVTVTGKHNRANSPVPGPSHVLSQPEQINQLIEMFPDSTREDISTSLALHGTVARAALSLSTTLTNDKDDSDSDLAEPVTTNQRLFLGYWKTWKIIWAMTETNLRLMRRIYWTMLWHTIKMKILIQRKSSGSYTTSSLLQTLVG